MSKTYLGDAVYAELDAGRIKLTVEYGLGPASVEQIYLEPQVLAALAKWYELTTAVSAHFLPKIDETCDHDWIEVGKNPDHCSKCGLSFLRYIHA